MEAKNVSASAATEQKQIKMKIDHLKREIPGKKEELKSMGKTSSKLQEDYDKVTNDIANIEKLLSKINFNEDIENALKEEKKQITSMISKLREDVDSLQARLSRLRFDYYDPSPNFDRSKVKGLLAHLVNIKQPDRHAIALEVTGLYFLFPSRHSFFLLPF